MESFIFKVLIILPISTLIRQRFSNKVREQILQKKLHKDSIYEHLHVDYLIRQACR